MGTTKTRQAKLDFMKEALEVYFKQFPKGTVSRKRLLQKFALAQKTTMRTGWEVLSLTIADLKLKIEGDNITK